MKIAVALFKYFDFGGLQLDTVRLIDEALVRGHQVTLFIGAAATPPPQRDGLSVRELKLSSWSSHRRAVEFEAAFHRAVQQENFDLTLAMNRIRGCDFYFAADNCAVDTFYQKHPAWLVRMLPRYRVFSRLETGIFAPGVKTGILYISEQQYKAYTARYKTEKNRFFLLPPGIPETYRNVRRNPAAAANLKKEFNLADSAKTVLTVAANFQLKGVDRALQTLGQLPDEIRQDLVYLLIGPGEPAEWHKAIRASGIDSSKVIFTGKRNDTPALLSGADMMLHLPYEESAGTVITEALSCGLPVICSANCGFASLARQAGMPVWEPGSGIETAAAMVAGVLKETEIFSQKCLDFAATVDLFGRAAAAWDFMEHHRF